METSLVSSLTSVVGAAAVGVAESALDVCTIIPSFEEFFPFSVGFPVCDAVAVLVFSELSNVWDAGAVLLEDAALAVVRAEAEAAVAVLAGDDAADAVFPVDADALAVPVAVAAAEVPVEAAGALATEILPVLTETLLFLEGVTVSPSLSLTPVSARTSPTVSPEEL